MINTTTGQDESQFIASAIFVPTDATFGSGTTPTRNTTSDPFTGRIDLTFLPGLPAGSYTLAGALRGHRERHRHPGRRGQSDE